VVYLGMGGRLVDYWDKDNNAAGFLIKDSKTVG
jgi:hypothetical protein